MDVDHTDVDAWTLSPLAKILITCLFAGISVIGVVGNFLVITLVLALPNMRTSFNLCLASLALADLMALTFQPIVTLRDLHNCDHSILGRSLCVIISSIERGSSVCGDLTFLLIGVERYTMLCHPLRTIGMWTRPKVCFVLLLIWIITVTVSIPFGYAARYEEIHANNFSDGVHDIGYHKPWIAPVQQSILGSNSTIKGTYCYIAFDIPWVMWYQTALICVSVFVPVPILATLCGKMILALRNRVSKNHCEGLGTRARRKSRSRIILMLVLVVIIFIVCHLPFKVQTLVRFYDTDAWRTLDSKSNFIYVCISSLMLCLNHASHPIIYFVMSTNFRDAFIHCFCTRCCKQLNVKN